MNWAREKFLNCGNRYRNHQKLVLYRHYVVHFINASKHIDDIEPDIRKLMIVDFEADVVFVVDDLKFPGYKRILKISNESFYVEHVEPHENSQEIEIEGVDPRGFQQFLRFCHFGDINLNPLNMLQTYDVAQTYNNSRLADICFNFICSHIETTNVLEILNWNLTHQNYGIQKLCRGFLVENTVEVLKDSENFLNIDKTLLKMILSWEILNCSEKLLFMKTLSWAERKCQESNIEPTVENRKSILEDILYLIRLEISTDLEIINDFPTKPRKNRFSRKRFDHIFMETEISKTCEEFPPNSEDRICHGFSIIISNPDSRSATFEEFLMTIESVHDLVFQNHFLIKASDFLVIKDFIFEKPIVIQKLQRHTLIVKFVESSRLRYLGKDGGSRVRILRLYNN